MSDLYILDENRNPARVSNVLEWGAWMQGATRHVAKSEVNGVQVSTVFLGIDHNWGWQDRPVLFETMVFGGKYDLEQERYCTWSEAEAGHERWVAKVEESEQWPASVEEEPAK